MARASLAVLMLACAPLLLSAQSTQTFEVASIKKSPPPGNGGTFINTGSRKGSTWTAANATLRMLVVNAYFPRYQMAGQIIGGPSWFEDDRFDITAKMDAAASADDVRAMMRALLADRFKLSTHAETRELSVYALVVARSDSRLGSQLKPLDVDCVALQEARRRGEAPIPPRKPGEPPPPCMSMMMFGPVSRVESSGITMEALISSLSSFTGRPVIDRTGLKGYYSLKLEFAGEPGVAGPFGNGPAGPAAAASSDAASIFSAIVDQLGLKLDARREPVDVLVIDRAEQPTPD
jgi:uncharacterized protein (TIGR03435 family)